MRIRLTKVYVDDQDKALRFYECWGSGKGGREAGRVPLADRGLPEEPDGTDCSSSGGEGGRYRRSSGRSRGGHPRLFETDDVRRDHGGWRRRASVTLPPTEVTGSTIAIPGHTCGNLIQARQYHRRGVRRARRGPPPLGQTHASPTSEGAMPYRCPNRRAAGPAALDTRSSALPVGYLQSDIEGTRCPSSRRRPRRRAPRPWAGARRRHCPRGDPREPVIAPRGGAPGAPTRTGPPVSPPQTHRGLWAGPGTLTVDNGHGRRVRAAGAEPGPAVAAGRAGRGYAAPRGDPPTATMSSGTAPAPMAARDTIRRRLCCPLRGPRTSRPAPPGWTYAPGITTLGADGNAETRYADRRSCPRSLRRSDARAPAATLYTMQEAPVTPTPPPTWTYAVRD